MHLKTLIHYGFIANLNITFSVARKFCNRIGKRSIHYCNGLEYNPCYDFCCGGSLLTNVTTPDSTELNPEINLDGIECCGDSISGEFYDTTVSTCCSSSHRFYNEESSKNTSYRVYHEIGEHMQCCHNGNNVPQLFNTTFQMCCAGMVNFSGDNPGDTQYTNCCNDVSYDRRFYSCPCHDGSLKPVPEGDSRCCVSRFDHLVKTGYDFESEICSASGQVGKMSENIICGDYLAVGECMHSKMWDNSGSDLAQSVVQGFADRQVFD